MTLPFVCEDCGEPMLMERACSSAPSSGVLAGSALGRHDDRGLMPWWLGVSV